MVFFLQAKLQHVQRKIGEMLQIYGAWDYFDGQVLLFAGPSPIFIGAKKMTILQWRQWRFLFCHANSQKLASEDRESYWDISYGWFSLINILLFRGTLPNLFTGDKKLQIWEHF